MVSFIYAPGKIIAQVADTLEAVKVFSKKPLDITTSTVFLQQLNKKSLAKLNSVSVADAVKYFSGVVVKDYGGIGGLKTVSVRSLGANHTGIMYDGVMIADAQGGQIDLGRFSLDNIESIQLFINQPTDILLPARSYGSASVLALTSSSSVSSERLNTELVLKLKTGSFGFINPSIFYKRKINKKILHSIDGEYQSAKGDFSFIDYETGKGKNKRINSDIKSYRLEYDAVYAMNDSNQLKFKAYYYNSKRGLPGSVVLYNPFSDERLDNKSFFSQLCWKKNVSRKSRVLISAKFSADNKFYLDPSYQNYAGKLKNDFHQDEFYLSAAYSYNVFRAVSIGYAIDYFRTELNRTDSFAAKFANPGRHSLLSNLILQWKKPRFEISGNILYTYISEKVDQGPKADSLYKLTPAIAATVQPFRYFPFRIRASYKNIFRAPTFDDLYYTNIGNAKLRPEYASQYDAGITFSGPDIKLFKAIVFTADIYYNKVTDKIIAVPRQNLFQWTMLNIAAADARGLDATLHLALRQYHQVEIAGSFTYSYQRSLDVSNPENAQYKTQLPYTPEHSGSINLNINYGVLAFNYNVIFSSNRYRLGDHVQENLVKGWTTHDSSISYPFASKKHWEYKVAAEVNNVYNHQYEIIKYYPMPRFNYRLTVIVSFKKQ